MTPAARSLVRVARRTVPLSAVSASTAAKRIPSRCASTALRAQARPAPAAVVAARQATPQRRLYSTDESKVYSFEDMQKIIADPSPTRIIIDAREPHELADTGRIPGAQNIPVASQPSAFFESADEFEEKLGFAQPPRDAELVFYCKAGVRSRAAAQLARQAGWANTAEYPGSWLDWFEKGGKVER